MTNKQSKTEHFRAFLTEYYEANGGSMVEEPSPVICIRSTSYNELRSIQASIRRYFGFPNGRLRGKGKSWTLRYRKAAAVVLINILFPNKFTLSLDIRGMSDFWTCLNARLPQNEVEEIVRSINIETKQVDWWKPVAGGYSNVDTAIDGIVNPENYQGT